MLTELFLAGRYLKPKRNAVSLITLSSVLGVTLGVAVLMVVLAVMTGFTDLMKQKLVETQAHFQVRDPWRRVIRDPSEIVETVRAAGQSCPVQAELVRRYFPTTDYANGLTLPAGWYDAVQVKIGAAAGHNWFCVLYPSLCEAAAGGGYARPEENDLVVGDYVLRFAALEWWQRITGQAE